MFDHYSSDSVLNVKAMARQTGVAAATLRAWERRYGVPSPRRTDSGYRLYSARDVAVIRWLKAQIENGMSISRAVSLLRSIQLRASLDGVEAEEVASRTIEAHSPSASPSSYYYQRWHDNIIAAAKNFDEERIESTLGEAISLYSVEDVCVNLVQPVLVTSGDLWHSGEINVSVEHFITGLIRRKLQALMAAAPVPARQSRIISGCAPLEYHEIGILMVSLFLRRRSYPVTYLGQSISNQRLTELLQKTQPDMLLLSTSSLRSAAQLLDIAEDIRGATHEQAVTLAYGGRIFNKLPALLDRVPGLYVGENAQQAAQRIVELLTHRTALLEISVTQLTPTSITDALRGFRTHRAEIVALTTKAIQSAQAEWPDGAPVRPQIARETSDNLAQVFEAALRFDEATVLGDLSNWQWEALPPDGMPLQQLRYCASQFIDSIKQVFAPAHLAAFQPFLSQLELSLRLRA